VAKTEIFGWKEPTCRENWWFDCPDKWCGVLLLVTMY